ncbi:HD-GYP domain-containing protein [Teredinibacter turnerae]|uniref:HD-GYP domain-containing protein n=1 Tax=Teredinibacter turnerae TaxID=2426 RepID=UPI0005F8277D|nr:HD-GYP domain-containing protein [Teredinibacter turnerae]
MLSLEQKEVHVSQLKHGMFVSRLDVPWERTHFPLQGILIRSESDIEQIAAYCNFVIVDETRSCKPARIDSPMGKAQSRATACNAKPAWQRRHCVEKYPIRATVREEVHLSHSLLSTMERQIYLICEHTLRCKRANIEQLVDSSSEVVESVIRNPDALAWLCRVRASRRPIYMHTIRLAVWGTIAGRQLGLNRFSLNHMCTALLMTGIGKSSVSDKALAGYSPTKPSLEYRQHLQETLYQLEQLRFYSDDITDTVAYYCERIDGSGYPNQVTGSEIPFLAQICGLVETYELLINPYHCTRAISPANAVVYLNKAKNQQFDASLVEEFIKAIGIYPTGTVVELSSGELGVIVSQDSKKRLRASVVPVLSAQGDILKNYRLLDLSYASGRDEDQTMAIRRGVPSSVVPRGILEETHSWLFDRRSDRTRACR